MSETDFGQNGGANGLEMKTPPIHIKAGPQRVSVAFVQRLDGPVDDLIAPLENTLADVNISYGVTALPHMRDMTDHRTVGRHGRVGDAEPQAHLHLPAASIRRRKRPAPRRS